MLSPLLVGLLFLSACRADISVYSDNALSGQFADWSWGSSVSYTSTGVAAHSGSNAIQVQVSSGSYGGLSLYMSSGNFLGQAYLQFWVQPTISNAPIVFCVYATAESPVYQSQFISIPGLSPGTWTLFKYPILAGHNVNRFSILSMQNDPETFYVDDINFVTAWPGDITVYQAYAQTSQFGDWSWNAASNYAATSPLLSGSATSLSVTVSANAGLGGLSLYYSGGTLPATGALSFSIYPVTASPNIAIRWHVAVPGQADTYSVDQSSFSGLTVGQWNSVVAPVPNDGHAYNRFSFVDESGQGTQFALDNVIVLASTAALSVSPSPLPPSASSTPVSASVSPSFVFTASASPSASFGAPAVRGLKVTGNMLTDLDGNLVHIRGANRAGTEYACIQGWGFIDGPATVAALQAMTAWTGMNAVRVPLNEDCWLGINVNNAYTGSAYQNFIINWVSMIQAQGMWVILDLHWTAPGSNQASGQTEMANTDHSPTLWTSVANTFKSNLGVIFEMFNEPFPQNGNVPNEWSCTATGTNCGLSYSVAGYQQLVTTVRATGAQNVILCGGPEWSNRLDQWLANKPTDPTGNLGAAWHSYNFNRCSTQSCWDSEIAPVIAQVPLVVTELGENDCGTSYISQLLPWLEAHCTGYLAWEWGPFSCTGGPALTTDWNGTPSGFGIGYQQHIATASPQCGSVSPTRSPVSVSPAAVSLTPSHSPVSVSASVSTSLTAAPSTTSSVSLTPTKTAVSVSVSVSSSFTASTTPSQSLTPQSNSVTVTPSFSASSSAPASATASNSGTASVSITASSSPVSVSASLSASQTGSASATPVSASVSPSGGPPVALPGTAGVINGYYTSTQTMSGQATFMGPYSGSGACSSEPVPAWVAAHGYNVVAPGPNVYAGSASCGMCIEYTGTGVGLGTTPLTGTFYGYMYNECGGCSAGNSDFGMQVTGNGNWAATWRAVDCPVSGAVQYACQGSGPYYIKLQVLNAKEPTAVIAIQATAGGAYVNLPATIDGYFASSFPQPVPFPASIRVTGVDGQTFYDTISTQCFSGAGAFSGTNPAAQYNGHTNVSPVPSQTSTAVPSVSVSPSLSASNTASISTTAAPSTTQSITASSTPTISTTGSTSASISLTASRSQPASATPTLSLSATTTPSSSPSASASSSPVSATSSPSASGSSAASVTPAPSLPPSPNPTAPLLVYSDNMPSPGWTDYSGGSVDWAASGRVPLVPPHSGSSSALVSGRTLVLGRTSAPLDFHAWAQLVLWVYAATASEQIAVTFSASSESYVSSPISFGTVPATTWTNVVINIPGGHLFDRFSITVSDSSVYSIDDVSIVGDSSPSTSPASQSPSTSVLPSFVAEGAAYTDNQPSPGWADASSNYATLNYAASGMGVAAHSGSNSILFTGVPGGGSVLAIRRSNGLAVYSLVSFWIQPSAPNQVIAVRFARGTSATSSQISIGQLTAGQWQQRIVSIPSGTWDTIQFVDAESRGISFSVDDVYVGTGSGVSSTVTLTIRALSTPEATAIINALAAILGVSPDVIFNVIIRLLTGSRSVGSVHVKSNSQYDVSFNLGPDPTTGSSGSTLASSLTSMVASGSASFAANGLQVDSITTGSSSQPVAFGSAQTSSPPSNATPAVPPWVIPVAVILGVALLAGVVAAILVVRRMRRNSSSRKLADAEKPFHSSSQLKTPTASVSGSGSSSMTASSAAKTGGAAVSSATQAAGSPRVVTSPASATAPRTSASSGASLVMSAASGATGTASTSAATSSSSS